LVLDVVKAADPADVQAAQAKLLANRAAFAANSLAENGNGFDAAVDVLKRTSTSSQAGLANTSERTTKTDKVPEVYQKFEAMVLQNFLQNMMPKSETFYGKGAAGEIWKGMMADQISGEMSKSGGVGIAEKMYQDQLQKVRGNGVANAKTDENDRKMALSMITEFERKSLAPASADDATTSATSQGNVTTKEA
jgi:Rod binding domain-containing protein